MAATPADIEGGTTSVRVTRRAARFFWAWLVIATSMSVTGNVAHAVMQAPANTIALAAGAALVPPVVLLAATHSIAMLVRTRAGGATYWCALAMTLALAACAFVLSFDALRSLAVTLGLPTSIAWLWPCAIDVAIAQATLCLLSLSRRRSSDTSWAAITPARSRPIAETRARRPTASADSGAAPATTPNRVGSPLQIAPSAAPAAVGDTDSVAIGRWKPVAESLVRQGVTSKEPVLVARILAHHEAGMPPSTIGRTFNVHHTTVGRILSAADGIAG